MTISVIALPGGVNPAPLRYAPLASALAGEVDFHLKDLEVYARDEPPAGYSIDLEVDAVARFADSVGLERFHLLGYSGGGYVALAFAGAHRERLLSLALFEPARVPGPPTPAEAALHQRLEKALAGLDGSDFLRAFMETQVAPGVRLAPPAGPPPPWMRSRPAGLAAMMVAFDAYTFDRSSLRRCDFPVFLGYGELTGEYEAVKVSILSQLLPDVHIRRFAAIHHFVFPEELYSPQHVAALVELWTRADRLSGRARGEEPAGSRSS